MPADPEDDPTFVAPSEAASMEASLDAAIAENQEKDDPNAVLSSLHREPPKKTATPAAKTGGAQSNVTRTTEKDVAAADAKKSATKTTDKPNGTTATEVDDDTDEETDKLSIGRHAARADREGWEHLKKIAKDRKLRIRALEKEQAAAKSAGETNSKAAEELQSVQEELTRLRRMELVHSPDTSRLIAQQYVAKQDKSDEKLLELLQKGNMPQVDLDRIKAGGIGRWTRDAWIAGIEKQKLTPSQKRDAMKLVDDWYEAADEKREAIEKAAEEFKSTPELVKKRQEENSKAYREKLFSSFIERVKNPPEWAKYDDVDNEPNILEDPAAHAVWLAKLPADQQARWNYMYKELRPVRDKAAMASGPEDHAELIEQAIKAYHYEKEHGKLLKRVEELEAELAKAKGETVRIKTKSRIGRLVPSTPTPTKPKGAGPGGLYATLEENLDAALGNSR